MWWQPLSDWIEHHPALASWLQAIGAIVGLGVAIYVPWSQRRNEARVRADQDRVKARSVAIAISPDLVEVLVLWEKASAIIQNETAQGPTYALEQLISDITIPLPETLVTYEKRLYWMGEPVGPDVQQLVSVIRQYNGLVETIHQQAINYTIPYDPKRVRQSLAGQLQAMRLCLNSIDKNLTAIHDNPSTDFPPVTGVAP